MRKQIGALVKSFAREERGATMIEYAILVGLVTAAIVATIGLMSGQIDTIFQNISTSLGTVETNTGTGTGG
jgi:pilus assembly protein Flp/PilA